MMMIDFILKTESKMASQQPREVLPPRASDIEDEEDELEDHASSEDEFPLPALSEDDKNTSPQGGHRHSEEKTLLLLEEGAHKAEEEDGAQEMDDKAEEPGFIRTSLTFLKKDGKKNAEEEGGVDIGKIEFQEQQVVGESQGAGPTSNNSSTTTISFYEYMFPDPRTRARIERPDAIPVDGLHPVNQREHSFLTCLRIPFTTLFGTIWILIKWLFISMGKLFFCCYWSVFSQKHVLEDEEYEHLLMKPKKEIAHVYKSSDPLYKTESLLERAPPACKKKQNTVKWLKTTSTPSKTKSVDDKLDSKRKTTPGRLEAMESVAEAQQDEEQKQQQEADVTTPIAGSSTAAGQPQQVAERPNSELSSSYGSTIHMNRDSAAVFDDDGEQQYFANLKRADSRITYLSLDLYQRAFKLYRFGFEPSANGHDLARAANGQVCKRKEEEDNTNSSAADGIAEFGSDKYGVWEMLKLCDAWSRKNTRIWNFFCYEFQMRNLRRVMVDIPLSNWACLQCLTDIKVPTLILPHNYVYRATAQLQIRHVDDVLTDFDHLKNRERPILRATIKSVKRLHGGRQSSAPQNATNSSKYCAADDAIRALKSVPISSTGGSSSSMGDGARNGANDRDGGTAAKSYHPLLVQKSLTSETPEWTPNCCCNGNGTEYRTDLAMKCDWYWISKATKKMKQRQKCYEFSKVADQALLDQEFLDFLENPNVPIILYIHGGAYVLMGTKTCRMLSYALTHHTESLCFAINYRRPPMCRDLGVTLDDCLQAYNYLTEKLGIPHKRINVMGDSAGGALCLSLLQQVKRQQLNKEGVTKENVRAHMPNSACLFCPWADLSHNENTCASFKLNSPHDIVDAATVMRAATEIVGGRSLYDPIVSPIYGDLTGMPPILIQVGEKEVLRDIGVELALKIRECDPGNVVQLEIYQDMNHTFQIFNMTHICGKKALANVAEFLHVFRATNIEDFAHQRINTEYLVGHYHKAALSASKRIIHNLGSNEEHFARLDTMGSNRKRGFSKDKIRCTGGDEKGEV